MVSQPEQRVRPAPRASVTRLGALRKARRSSTQGGRGQGRGGTMKLISESKELQRQLLRCMKNHEKISFAVAWATTGTKVYDALVERREAIHHGVVGTHFYQTSPEVLEDFTGDDRVRFVLQPSGVFHPKIFLFRSGRRWEAFVGSANLTRGALGANAEVVMHVTNDDDADHIRSDVQDAIKRFRSEGKKAKPEHAEAYRETYERMKKVRDRLSGGYGSAKSNSPLQSEVMSKSWKQFYAAVREPGEGYLQDRIELLADARDAFRMHESFAAMDVDTRAMIAGLPNGRTRNQGYFGSMKGDGVFHGAIKGDTPGISAALDRIPLDGPVTREHYEAFVSEFEQALPDGRRRPGVASRLLAMKRPDTFVCLSKRNRAGLAEDFGISAGGIDFDVYWDSVVGRIVDSRWWSAAAPSGGSELAAWQGRAAMLDAIFYDHDEAA